MKTRWIAGLLVLAMGMSAGIADAHWRKTRDGRWVVDHPNHLGLHLGIYGNAGMGAFAMHDENQYLQDFNADSRSLGGNSIRLLDSGPTWNVGVLYGIHNRVAVGLEYEALYAETHGTPLPGESFAIHLPASSFGAFAKALAPVGRRLLFSAGVGVYSLWLDQAYERYSRDTGTSTTWSYYGRTTAVKAWLGMEFFFLPTVSLGVDGGYRSARIGLVTDEEGRTWRNPDGSNFTVDYSGPFAQAGVRAYF